MTVASVEINLQSKHDFICHLGKVKAATLAHSMADVILFFSAFIIPFESNASIKPKENIFYSQQRKQYPENCPCINVLKAFGEQTSHVAWNFALRLVTDKKQEDL